MISQQPKTKQMIKNMKLLENLCKKFPDGYVTTRDKETYVPIRIEMFNFSYIRMRQDQYSSRRFIFDEYNNLPILLTLENEEIETFNELYHLLLHQENTITDKVKFIILIDKICNEDEIKNIMDLIEFSTLRNRRIDFLEIKDWAALSEYEGFRPTFIDDNTKIVICKKIYKDFGLEIFLKLSSMFDIKHVPLRPMTRYPPSNFGVSNICVEKNTGRVYNVHIVHKLQSESYVLLYGSSSWDPNDKLNVVSPFKPIDTNYKIIHCKMPEPYYFCEYCQNYKKPHRHGN